MEIKKKERMKRNVNEISKRLLCKRRNLKRIEKCFQKLFSYINTKYSEILNLTKISPRVLVDRRRSCVLIDSTIRIIIIFFREV